MNESNILVAVSSPWASEKLIEPIADLVGRLAASAVVVHVTTLHAEDERESDATQRAEQTLKLLSEGLEAHGLPAEGVMLFSDDTPKAILNTAHARGCTMIVLGLAAQGGLRRRLLGDVPRKLIDRSDLPVLLCPAAWSGRV